MADPAASKPHVLMFPMPIQGHMPPMLKLAELFLSSADFFITFVNTEHSHRRFSRHSPALERLNQHPNFQFRTIPDGLPDDNPRQALQFMQLLDSMRTRSVEPYRKLLVCPDEHWPPVSCVVADPLLSLAIDVAEEERVPVMIFRTSGACSFWVFRCVRELVRRGEVPFREGVDLDEIVTGVDGMESFLRRRDLPHLCREAKSADDPRLRIMTMIADNASRGRALIMNTFRSLESPYLSRIRSFCPVIYALGPIHMLARTIGTSAVAANLWQEDRECMKWLDSQPDRSVAYVSFGSVAVMSREEQVELWHGLVNSGHRFLWVVLKDLVMVGSDEREIPASAELEEGTRERGCLVSWAPQEEVLAHRAVGCFLTHSGWNSTMESVAAGVPMICRPFITDQSVNSRLACKVWEIGLDLENGECERGVIAERVRDAMGGDKAEELRKSIGEMAGRAKRSVEEGGDSYLDLQLLVRHIKSL